MIMEKLKLEAPWDEVKEKLKEVNPDLTEEDLEYSGDDDALIKNIAKKMNRSEAETRGWIESVSFNNGKAG